MRLIWFSLKMESVYEMSRVCIDLLFWNPLSYKTDIVVYADNTIITKQFFMNFAVVRLIHAYRAFAVLVVEFGFLYQSSNQIRYIPILRNENVKKFLRNVSASLCTSDNGTNIFGYALADPSYF